MVFVWEADTPTLLFLPQSQQLVNDTEEFARENEISGSDQLAVAILLDFTGDVELTVQHHQSFQQQVIAPVSRDQRFWCLTAQPIQSFLESCLETSRVGNIES